MDPTKKKKEDEARAGLIDLAFSWSISDIMNKDLYKDKVKRIPDTFASVEHYLSSFVHPLIEETHADLRSNMMNLRYAPACEILDVKTSKLFKPPKNLLYKITLTKKSDDDKQTEMYEPECWDLIALSEVRPKRIDDLNGSKRSYLVALVNGMKDEGSFIIPILSSKIISFEKTDKEKGKVGDRLFAVYLTNLNTNIRIWKALHPSEGANAKIFNSVLQITPSTTEEICTLCSSKEIESTNLSNSRKTINSFSLNDSQKDAVLDCIALSECRHQNSVKLLWGPPGTGKTKTIASLVFTLLRMKCRALACAPTNVAVIGVAKRLMSCLSGKLEYNAYGLGDIVLFGNGKRMKIDDHEDLDDVFLDYRVSVLAQCFAPLTGWNGSLDKMIRLLEDPKGQYRQYLFQQKQKNNEDDSDSDDEEGKSGEQYENKKESLKRNFLKKLITKNIKEEKKERKNAKENKNRKKATGKKKEQCQGNDGKASKQNIPWTFVEFFTKTLAVVRKQLIFCTTGLYTHMPTSQLPREALKDMIKVLDLLKVLDDFFVVAITEERKLKHTLFGNNKRGKIRLECLKIMKFLRENFLVPDFIEYYQIKNFCLYNACLIFCTVSSSAKLHTEGMTPLEMVIIDEAAQLKECESCIPLQLNGVRHAILVGDEKQLPAMVISKICEKADFGRSLFERLVILGHSRHLLNVQYRMHPSISVFPNKEFYGKQITDGRNVTLKSYDKQLLKENFFGPYSFINVTHGKEEFDNKSSRKNVVEVSVVAEIVSRLYKESIKYKKKVSVGCLSPYRGQVTAIQESLGNTYSTDPNDTFSVNVRSVDGFQGGEEDVIIISTVRCNGKGSVGFLDNRNRTNVALTRARFCLWILGNGATLLNSGSVWQKLVIDAQKRGCFYNVYEDKNLSVAVSNALIELRQLNSLFSVESILFKESKWKVCFSAKFNESITRFHDLAIHRELVSVLMKLSNGWRQKHKNETYSFLEGASSQLLEMCDVNGPVKLIWTIDILREKSIDTQVIKILDILPQSEIPDMARKFDIMFGNYTVNQMSRCMCKRTEGELLLPMTWKVDVHAEGSYSSSELVTQLAALSLRDETRSLARGARKAKYGTRRRTQSWNRKS